MAALTENMEKLGIEDGDSDDGGAEMLRRRY